MSTKGKRYLITTAEFIQIFPQRIKPLVDHYQLDSKPKITHRTFRYYVTKGLMVKPIIKNKKAYYEDVPAMYKRLFVVWYLIHYQRRSVTEINKVMKLLNSKEDLVFVTLLLDDVLFFDNLILSGGIKKAIREELGAIDIGKKFVYAALIELLEDDYVRIKGIRDMMEEFKKFPSYNPKIGQDLFYYKTLEKHIDKNLSVIQNIIEERKKLIIINSPPYF